MTIPAFRASDKPPFFVDDGDAVILGCPCVTHGTVVIRGAIIDQNNFQNAVGLVHDGLDTAVQIRFNLVYGDNDAIDAFS